MITTRCIGGRSDNLWPQPLGLAFSPLAVCDRVSSLCPFLMQSEHTDGHTSVQSVIEKLQEENRLLKQKVTHVSVFHISFEKNTRLTNCK